MSNPITLAICAALLFGAAAPFNKILLHPFSPFQLAGILYLGAGLGAFVLLKSRGESLGIGPKLGKRNAVRLAMSVLFGGILGPLFLLKGLEISQAGTVSLWLVMEMVLTALLGHLFFKDYLGKSGWIGAAGCLAGSVFLSLGDGSEGLKAGVWVMLACFCWAIDNNFTALIDALKPLQSTFWKGVVAGSLNLLIGLLCFPFHANESAVILGLLLGALSYGASLALYIQAAQSLGAVRSQMIFASAPFFGLSLSSLLLREGLGWVQGAAAILFGGSLFFLFRERHSHWHEHVALEHIHAHRHDDGHHVHVHTGSPGSLYHSHSHQHEPIAHTHPHWPDLHHRHEHRGN